VLYKTKRSILSNCEDHLNYLENTYNLFPIDYDRNFSKQYEIFFNFFIKLLKIAKKGKQNPIFLPFLMLVLRTSSIISYLTEREVCKNKKDLDADRILMDFGKENGFYGSAIVKILKNSSSMVVGYAHGFSIYTNPNPLQKDKAILNPFKSFFLKISKPKRKRSYCDRYVVGKDQKSTYFSSSMMKYEKKYLDRVYEIGAIRYTSEWIFKYRNNVITLKNFTYGSKEKLNVVLFMSHPAYNVNMKELMNTIKKLSLCNSINFVYKPHTRSGLDRIRLKELNGFDASSISSLELSSWADIGIVYGSSIAFQLLMDNVSVIMPKYVHNNTTILEENNVCIVANDISSLMDIMGQPIEEVSSMISKKKVSNFINYYIYGEKKYPRLMDYFYKSVMDFEG